MNTIKRNFDQDWQNKYRDMIKTPELAVKDVKAGQRVFVGTGCAQPQALLNALTARKNQLSDTEIVHLLTMGDAPYAEEELSRCFRVNSFFIAENVRDVIQEGLGDYTPIFLSEIPGLFMTGQLPLDVALIQVSPPDERGMCSLGISVDIVKSAAENAALVIAQVNPNMPRTHGESFLHVHDMDVLVPVDAPLLEVIPPEPDDIIKKIGQFIAALVEDESTIEFGIGAIPQAVMGFLQEKKNLGIHTEMFTDSIIDLIESGAVNGSHKSLDRGKVVASFCMGTKKLYDYIDDNPDFVFYPTEYVNNPYVISRQNKQVAINVALQIDLTGQVCADSLGIQFFSGIGGQVDFNRGAAGSPGGRAIIAMPSTAKNGTISRIVTMLSPGAGVVTTRGDVHYVVTEYGTAYLHGKSIQERTLSLICIAHPDFREQLIKDAVENKYLPKSMAKLEGKTLVGPPDFKSSFVINDGTQVNLRTMHPTDEPRVKDMFYTLSQETIYYRFMSRSKKIQRNEIQNFVFVNHRTEVAIVATVPEAHGEDIVGIGRYYLNEETNFAEVAFVIRDSWQNKGIGGFLLSNLATLAKRNGISGFTAEVLPTNKLMQRVFNKSDFKVTSQLQEDVVSFKIEFLTVAMSI
ncbi:MAG: GNAT family N-acetyltransferase [Fibrobacteria bacterium]|nr:GNAT family N-acetyltransferase [Fibrobacteria bacterium]